MESAYAQDENPRSSLLAQQRQVAQETSMGYYGVSQDRLNVSHVGSIQAGHSIHTLVLEDEDFTGTGYATELHIPGTSFSSQPMPSDGNDLDVPPLAGDFDLGLPHNTQSMPSGASYPLFSLFPTDKDPLYAAEPNPKEMSYLQKPYGTQPYQVGPYYAPIQPTLHAPGFNDLEVLPTSEKSTVYHKTQAPSAHMVGIQIRSGPELASGSASLNTFSAHYPEIAPPDKVSPNAAAVVPVPAQGPVLQGIPSHGPIPPLRSVPRVVNGKTSYQLPEELARKLGIPDKAWKDVNHCYDARFALRLLACDEYIAASP